MLNIIFLYQLTEERGQFAVLRDSIAGITGDSRLQLLLIAFCFGAFFEGAAGFGTPVAVTAALLIGLGFLTSCLLASEMMVPLSSNHLVVVLRESLTIGGWVAMWKPLEIYLYDWWPVRSEVRIFQRLARMRVLLVVPMG